MPAQDALGLPARDKLESLPRTTLVFHVREPFAGHDWALSSDKTRLVRVVGCTRLGCRCGAYGGVTEVQLEPGEPEPDYDAVCRAARERAEQNHSAISSAKPHTAENSSPSDPKDL